MTSVKGVSALNASDYGFCASHTRHFWGFRLHGLFAPGRTPWALALTSPKIDEKLVCLRMGARQASCLHAEAIVCTALRPAPSERDCSAPWLAPAHGWRPGNVELE